MIFRVSKCWSWRSSASSLSSSATWVRERTIRGGGGEGMPSEDEDDEEFGAVGEYSGEEDARLGDADLGLGGGLYKGGGDRK